MNSGISSCSSIQSMVDQTPVYDRKFKRRKKKSPYQVTGQSGIIRPDKRHKAHFL